MAWFKRKRGGITTSTTEKKETPEGLWYKCPDCKHVMTSEDHIANLNVCEECGKHDRIGADVYFRLLFDDAKFKKFDENLVSADPLKFEDTKKYTDRLKQSYKKTGLTDAIQNAHGKINGNNLVISAMDFAFIGGSMGSVVGEKISRGIDKAIKLKCPYMIISKSGGARMMEAGISLMQLAKTSGKLGVLAENKLPYISFLTDPTTGGVTASYAMLGDINIAEPGALIGFAGPRVVKETIGKDLPEGFQTSEFVLDHGFLDFIVERKDLKDKLSQAIEMFKK